MCRNGNIGGLSLMDLDLQEKVQSMIVPYQKELKLSADDSIIGYLNKLGKEGWEVVQIHQPSWSSDFLKRLKQ
jgi:hypothetical protein